MARIREIILLEVKTTCDGRGAEKVCDEIIQTVRLFFDTIVATSARQFVEAQEHEIILRTSQLEHAHKQVQAATEELRSLAQSRLDLLRAVTHELRNALQPVQLAATFLLDESDPSNRREIGNRLVANATRLQALLDRLREIAEILSEDTQPHFEPVNLRDLLQALKNKYRAAAERKGVQFHCNLDVYPPEITSDPDKLHKIADNVISNSIRFTTAGFIRVEMAATEGGRWVLRITDTGRGINPSDARHIFREFHSAGEIEPTSVRLGLVITRHLARMLGGEVSFHSTVGEGSGFEVNLPLIQS